MLSDEYILATYPIKCWENKPFGRCRPQSVWIESAIEHFAFKIDENHWKTCSATFNYIELCVFRVDSLNKGLKECIKQIIFFQQRFGLSLPLPSVMADGPNQPQDHRFHINRATGLSGWTTQLISELIVRLKQNSIPIQLSIASNAAIASKCLLFKIGYFTPEHRHLRPRTNRQPHN